VLITPRYSHATSLIQFNLILKGRGFDPHSDQPVLKFLFFLRFLIFVSLAQPAKTFVGFGRLCVNQRDDQEKNHQVRQMRDIFSNASKVLVWLGTSDDDTSNAMTFFRLPRKIRDDSQKPMPGLLKLYRNPCWSRMWVVQEVLVAREDPVVCCGHECVPWEAVATTLLQVCWDELGRDRASRVLEDPTSLLKLSLLRSKKDSSKRKR
jgi:hypothetical protein